MPDKLTYLLKFNDETLIVRAESLNVLKAAVLQRIGFSAERVTVEDFNDPATEIAPVPARRGRPPKANFNDETLPPLPPADGEVL